MEKIYELKLHESCAAAGYIATRVPGGWLYYKENKHSGFGSQNDTYTVTCTFVPYSDEFF